MSDLAGAATPIDALEREIQEKQHELARLRAEAPREDVADYVFSGSDDREVRLSELFRDQRDLIVIHNMGSRCAYCTLWADSFNGVLPYIEDRTGFVLVSPDPPAKQREFAAERGWRFRMVSDSVSGFTEAMGYRHRENDRIMHTPGFSTFRRETEGRIARVSHAPFGPGDPYCGIWHLFALLEGGVGDWAPRFQK